MIAAAVSLIDCLDNFFQQFLNLEINGGVIPVIVEVFVVNLFAQQFFRCGF